MYEYAPTSSFMLPRRKKGRKIERGESERRDESAMVECKLNVRWSMIHTLCDGSTETKNTRKSSNQSKSPVCHINLCVRLHLPACLCVNMYARVCASVCEFYPSIMISPNPLTFFLPKNAITNPPSPTHHHRMRTDRQWLYHPKMLVERWSLRWPLAEKYPNPNSPWAANYYH